MIKFYIREPGGFYNETEETVEELINRCVQFTDTHFKTGKAKVFLDKAKTAQSHLNMRPGGLDLIRECNGGDVIICPYLYLMFGDRHNAIDEIGRLHRRRCHLFFLDALPGKPADSGAQILQVWGALAELEYLVRATITAQRDDTPKNFRAQRKKIAGAGNKILNHHEAMIDLMIHLRRRRLSWPAIRNVLKLDGLIDTKERRRNGWTFNKFKKLAIERMRKDELG